MTALAIARIRHRPLAIAACAAFAALMTGGVVNALFLQTHRHPAPLFRGAPAPAPAPAVAPKPEASAPAAPAAPAVAAAPAARQATPPTRPADARTADARTADVKTADVKTAGARPAAEAKSVETKTAESGKKIDAIGALLGAGAPAAETSASPKTVLAAQKALARLGYDVKADGVMGAATRQAIERFERSQKLPVTGELGARNVRKLAAASGVAVE